LHPWLHPSMMVPFDFKANARPIVMKPTDLVDDLMMECEDLVYELSTKFARAPVGLQISVLWNVKDPTKAFNPVDQLSKHFVDGDTFGVHGDIQQLQGKAGLRFGLGARVLLRTEEGWLAGTVVALNFRERNFPPGFTMPYQVEMDDDGVLRMVPEDNDMMCRELIPTWWEALFAQMPPVSQFHQKRAKKPDFGIKVLRAACQGKDVNEANHEGRTALAEVLRWRWSEALDVLLEMGANASRVDNKRKSILHHAVDAGSPDTVVSTLKTLLSAKANPNVHDRDPDKDPDFSSTSFEEREEHRTPLHYCAEMNSVLGAAVLLEARADPNALDSHYKTPLHVAIDEQGSGEMVEMLLRSGADPNLGNAEAGMSTSCLIVAARDGKADLASILIKASADLDRCGKQGMTALHMAVRGRRVDVATLLLEAKCDTSIKALGKTARDLALTNGVWALAEALGFADDGEPVLVTHMSKAQKKELFIE